MMKNVLITGATSGIGMQTAIQLSQSCSTFLLGRNHSELMEKKALGELVNAEMLTADITNFDQIKEVVEGLPVLNAVVLSAGVTQVKPFKFSDANDASSIMNINYESQVFLLNQLLKRKKIANGASIVMISSISGVLGMKGNSLYAGSKGAVIAFAKSLALELAPLKIRVNSILPGVVKTNMVKRSIDPTNLEIHEKLYPLGLGEPQDVANLIEFLVSDKSRWITGTSLTIDGGYSAQ